MNTEKKLFIFFFERESKHYIKNTKSCEYSSLSRHCSSSTMRARGREGKGIMGK